MHTIVIIIMILLNVVIQGQMYSNYWYGHSVITIMDVKIFTVSVKKRSLYPECDPCHHHSQCAPHSNADSQIAGSTSPVYLQLQV